jgi:type I restriction enzyme, S subunit
MNGWIKKELGEVCTLQRGFDLPTKQRREGNYPLISSSGCTDMQAEAKISGPGVVTGELADYRHTSNDSDHPKRTAAYPQD